MAGCSAVHCRNSSAKGYKMYAFPRDPVRRQQWLQNCRKGANWSSYREPTNNSRLCAEHFEEDQFERARADGLIKLKPNAIPTKFFPNKKEPCCDEIKSHDNHYLENGDIFGNRFIYETTHINQCFKNEVKVEPMDEKPNQEMYSQHIFTAIKKENIVKQEEAIETESNKFEIKPNDNIKKEKPDETEMKLEYINDDLKIEEEHLDDTTMKTELDSKETNRKSDLDGYILIKHNGKNYYQCEQCPYKTSRKWHFKRHMLCLHSENVYWYKCEHCSYKTKRKYELKRHFIYKHTQPEAIDWVQCDLCPYRAKRKECLTKHKIHKHSINVTWYECTQCVFKAKRKRKLKEHVINKHTAIEEINWLQCTHCSYKAKTKDCLKMHITRHKGRNWHKCAQCSFQTKIRGELYEHIKSIHKEVVWFNCEQCTFSTATKGNLKKHISSMHTTADEIVWFDCLHCTYRAKRKADLKRHLLRKHS